MTSKAASQDGFAPVLAALATMQSNGSRQEKSQAHEYLEQFQKSVGSVVQNSCTIAADRILQSEAWNTTHAILQSRNCSVEAKLFAATTLKGKVIRDSPFASGTALTA